MPTSRTVMADDPQIFAPRPHADTMLALLAWLSPAYPVSAYAYSHGLEQAVAEGAVRDPAGLEDWIAALLTDGSGWSDAVLLARTWRAERAGAGADLAETAALAAALSPARERREETAAQGAAFAETTAAAWGGPAGAASYPVALGRASACAGLPLEATIAAYLQGFAAMLLGASQRLLPLGQTEAQRLLARLSARLPDIAARAALESARPGGAAFAAEIAQMRHERLPVRLFRS
ncbi:MAG: urease accessory protein UreF [Paracoccaceae bacterium]